MKRRQKKKNFRKSFGRIAYIFRGQNGKLLAEFNDEHSAEPSYFVVENEVPVTPKPSKWIVTLSKELKVKALSPFIRKAEHPDGWRSFKFQLEQLFNELEFQHPRFFNDDKN